MKVTSLSLGGIGIFYDDIELPIQDIDSAPVVAIIGENGTGKTTALESIPGAIYRSMPSRGAIAGLATRRDSHVELGLDTEDGQLKLRLIIDGIAKQKKTEAYLIDADRMEPITDGKARTFDAEIARRLPSSQAYLASAFAAQRNKGRFLDLPPAQRKALFAELLGLEYLNQLSKVAGEQAREVETGLATLAGETRHLEAESANAANLRDQLDNRIITQAKLLEEAANLRSLSAVLKDAHEEWKSIGHGLEIKEAESKARVDKKRGEYFLVRNQRDEQQRQLDKHQSQAETIRNRLGDIDRLRKIAEQSNRERIDELDKFINKEQQRIAEVDDIIDVWNLRMSELKSAVMLAKSDTSAVSAARSDASASAIHLDNLQSNARRLDSVPCGGIGEYDACPLLAAAISAKAAIPEAIESKRIADNNQTKEQDAYIERVRQAQINLSNHEQSRPPDPDRTNLESYEREQAQLRDAEAKANDARAQLAALSEVATRLESLEADIESAQLKIGNLEAELSTIEKAGQEFKVQLESIQDQIRNHQGVEPRRFDEQTITKVESQLRDIDSEIAVLRERLNRAKDAELALIVVRKTISERTADLDDWQHLQKALGRNGIQALEIDCAGPEVSEICNDLLHSCYGSRFSVALETTALKADGKATKEVFDLRVIDTERGTDGSADQLSGGEQVLVSEALSLAICIYNARRSGFRMDDLFRDECAGALSQENSVRYVEMLRKALEIGGFHRVYFVAHQPWLWDLADARIVFEDGGCRIE